MFNLLMRNQLHIDYLGFIALVGLLLAFTTLGAAQEEPSYPVPPEAESHAGVPQGKIEGPFKLSSQVYPGTERDYWLYIPAQYDAEKPACTIIVQDGLNRAKEWRLPQVLDNLIHRKEVPPMIGIFVNPGVVPARGDKAQARFNRSFEYDALGDRYARFLIGELLPEVGKSYNLSADPNDRALAGASSGAICAFNAAWERPDAFRRVLSTIGTYVGLRGANQFPTLIRKTEPKPLRVFLQDGSHDLNIYAGDWFVANQDMLSALKYAGYEVKHAWGEGGHNGKHGAAILPEALRWLWRDHPQPIKAGANAPGEKRVDILLSDSGWEQVSSGHEQAEAPACNAAGDVFFCDSRAGRIYRVGEDGKTRVFAEQTGRISSMAFGRDGHLYACNEGRQILKFDDSGKSSPFLADTACQSLTTLPDGMYFSDLSASALFWCDYQGQKRQVDQLPLAVSGIVPSGDHAFLHVGGDQSPFTWQFRIGENRSLDARQKFGYLHLPDGELASGLSSMATDSEGRCYVTSKLGIQVLDQLGRVNLILNAPSTSPASGITFGGAAMDRLYVTSREKVFRRKLNAKGVKTFETPIQLPKPQL
jgi:gluconolactonase